MEIKILGTGCPNCIALEKRVRKIVEDYEIDAKITLVKDIMDIMAYKIMATPALVVDEEVLLKGRIPGERELLEMLSYK